VSFEEQKSEEAEMMKRMTLVAARMLIVAMEAGKFGLSAAGPRKATAETLKGLEGEFMKAAMERGSAGYMSFCAENAVELPNGAGAILGKASIAKGMGFRDDKGNRLTWSPMSADISA
jgi:hypothetical protein